MRMERTKKERTAEAKITRWVEKDDRLGEDARGGTKRSERDVGEIGLLGLGIGAAPAIRGLFHPYLDGETPRYTQTPDIHAATYK